MVRMKSTPGPWRVGDHNPGEAAPVLTEDDSVLVAEIAVQATGYDEQAANARLVAEAPALWAACAEAEADLSLWADNHRQPCDCATCKTLGVLRLVLARVEGDGEARAGDGR